MKRLHVANGKFSVKVRGIKTFDRVESEEWEAEMGGRRVAAAAIAAALIVIDIDRWRCGER